MDPRESGFKKEVVDNHGRLDTQLPGCRGLAVAFKAFPCPVMRAIGPVMEDVPPSPSNLSVKSSTTVPEVDAASITKLVL